jgi:dienelactone hydrolase
MQLSTVTSERGVTERRFDLPVGAATVPGLLWMPEGARGKRPLVLIGHGGTQHKRAENVLALGRRLVRHLGYAAVAIDAPDHGDRITAEQRERVQRQLGGRLPEPTPERVKALAERAAQVTTEWKAVIEAVHGLDGIEQGPLGYWGLSMGTAYGVPFLASEPRVQCAVLGLAGLQMGGAAFEQSAQRIAIPLLFMFQLNDELMTPQSGLALFSAFGSKVKSMHLNPGGHVQTPMFEREYYETFYERHLGRPSA